jgi:transcriptional regulator with XRE-family HTH domain
MALTIFVMPRKRHEQTDFGQRLTALRKARGLTQVELAERTGSTQRAISYYENEAGYPPAAALIELAKALRVTTDELLGLEAPRLDARDGDPDLRRLWKKFQQVTTLPERDQRAVTRLISSLAAASQTSQQGGETAGMASN